MNYLISLVVYPLLLLAAYRFWVKTSSVSKIPSPMKLLLMFSSIFVVLLVLDLIYVNFIHPLGPFPGAPDSGVRTSYFTLTFANSPYMLDYIKASLPERMLLYARAATGFFLMGFSAQLATKRGFILSALATALYGFYAMQSMVAFNHENGEALGFSAYLINAYPAVLHATFASLAGSAFCALARKIKKTTDNSEQSVFSTNQAL